MYNDLMGYTVTDFIDAIGPQFPLLSRYRETEQDPDWHAEGDVHIHTDMVLAQVYDIIANADPALDQARANILILAALFHDYAKPISTKVVDIKGVERVGAPRHEEAGAALLLFADPPFGLSGEDWLEVVQLVAYHHLPKKLVVKNQPRAEYARLTRQVRDIELLYMLELADMAGRHCADRQEQIDNIELFKLTAQEHGVWKQDPYAAIPSLIKSEFGDMGPAQEYRIAQQMMSRYEDGQIFMLEEELARAYQYKDEQSHIVALCGLPGAGKSTYTKQNYASYEIVSLDAIREREFGHRSDQSKNAQVVNLAIEELKEHLRNKRDVVWDATNFRKDFRTRIAGIGFNYNAFVEVVVLMTPTSVVKQRNRKRNDENVPSEVIDAQVKAFQLPDIDEGHALRFVLP